MEKVSILHLITAANNASPFDVNMAFDAGFHKSIYRNNFKASDYRSLNISTASNGCNNDFTFTGYVHTQY